MPEPRFDDPRPLSEPVFQIMLALADAPRHGLGIAADVERRTGGTLTLGVSTLYTAVKRLREGGLIREVTPPEAADPRRRYYELTEHGQVIVRLEARRLQGLVEQAQRKNVLPEPAS